MKRVVFSLLLVAIGNAFAGGKPIPTEQARPNVVFVLTDDQGYGDLGCHGNPILKTPELDAFHEQSVRFTDFHVSPLCTPTRGALMTGRDPGRNGAYRTSAGRSILHTNERTLGNLFADNGYATGMFGKWHLGDSAPHRPQDYGFQDVVWHRCGGIGQVSDYWGNDYFDDTYERNGTLEKFEGYCTDVWFREGIRFIEENKDKPFFLYLPLNAPHTPIIVGEEWSAPYKDKVDREILADYYGMIANIDHNFGLLRQRLKALKLEENTILIFMTDNGTYVGAKFANNDSEPVEGFNAGMRGRKASIFDGGHRVPFFIRWPAGGLDGGREIDTLAVQFDLFPTLAELCGIKVPADREMDGLSLAPLLKGESKTVDRDHVVLQFHGGAAFPEDRLKREFSYILTERWRLLHGRELYDMEADPKQRNDVAAEHPEVVKQLWAHYEPYWQSVVQGMTPVRLDLGNPTENPVELCSQDWYMPQGNPPWNFRLIGQLPRVTAPWMVKVKKAGRYRFTLRQYPKLAGKPVEQTVRAKIEIAGRSKDVSVEPGSMGIVIELELPAGETELMTYLYNETGEAGGAYFTEVEAL
ncbi:Arylsulfatase [Pontiella desulfatans]|uniref:Arylsulfatase n=1 Tax=Pontiella desulfatans TaxID=2750659 RepID=A0A6C2TW11_PONDE|nr:arylsulfatase [Pontiella desulfatans]SPS73620.1 sulfatase S1_17 [Kiritimatiellales bacterium]VGO11783.1 Arylsulfatase [Pontiella desulfatans]